MNFISIVVGVDIDTPMVNNPDFWLIDGHPMVNGGRIGRDYRI